MWRFHIRLCQCVSVQECSFGVKYHELSYPILTVLQLCLSRNAQVPMVVFLRSSSRSTSHFHAFAVTFIDVSPSTGNAVCVLSSTHVSHLALRQRLGTFRTISSLPFVLWPHRLSRVSLLSLRQCNRLHDRSRTCLRNCLRQARQARHTSQIRTPCLYRRLVAVYHSHVHINFNRTV